jgi:hypothetical protein
VVHGTYLAPARNFGQVHGPALARFSLMTQSQPDRQPGPVSGAQALEYAAFGEFFRQAHWAFIVPGFQRA